MKPIVTLTFNPAVDVSAAVPSVEPVHKLRCHDVRYEAGGGGINVARVLHRFDAKAEAIFTQGGASGIQLRRLLLEERVPHTAIPIQGDTREDFTAVDERNGAQFRFVLPGPTLSTDEIERCIAETARAAADACFVVASGSLPPGAPANTYRQLREGLPKHVPFALDTSGAALKAALGMGLTLIKPSRRELEDLHGTPLTRRDDCLAAARCLVADGAVETIALTLGAEGAILIGRDFAYEATTPSVTALSSIGAGDSFLAMLVLSLAEERSPREALQRATAAGTAALLSPGTGLCQPAAFAALLPRVEVRDSV